MVIHFYINSLRAIMNESIHQRRKRLLYQSNHRGIKELDTVFSAFATHYLNYFTLSELQEYEQFLNVPEKDLYAYLIQQQPLPLCFTANTVAYKIQQFVQKKLKVFLSL